MLNIGDREVGLDLKPYIIAEAAIQHHGRVNTAKSIARRAKRCGADAVKFQMFAPGEPLFCPMEGDEDRWPRWERSFMTFAQWRSVKEYCDEIEIDFLASAFQYKTVGWLKSLNVVAYKVASRAVFNFPYETTPGPFIISHGIDGNLPKSYPWGNDINLQCRAEYPHPPVAWTGNETYIGLSDHSGSPWPAIHAMARGCALIEVHVSFYKDKDIAASISPTQLRMLCDARDAFASLRSD